MDDITKFRQAIGLMTTALPNMVMEPDDPISMAHKVVAEVERLRAIIASVIAQLREDSEEYCKLADFIKAQLYKEAQ